MSKTSTKNWIKGSARVRTFENGGEIINLDLRMEDLLALPQSEKGYIKLTLSRKSEPDQFGNDYSISENTYVPPKKAAAPTADAGSAPAAPKAATFKGGTPFD